MANTASESLPVACRKRRWFQFSLRTLLVFVLLIGCGLGWLGVKIEKGRRQKAVVDAIHKAGVSGVTYDYQYGLQGKFLPFAEPPGPKWLQSLLGVDFFQTARTATYVQNSPLTAADLERVTELPELKSLAVLCEQRIPDAGLAPLAKLAQLEELYLRDHELTDAGLQYIKGLGHLRTLYLVNTRVTDAGLECLKELSQLEELSLADSHLTDAGLERLKGLGQLQFLDVMGTGITDAGLEQLKGLSRLRTLILDDTQVTGVGLAQLQGLSQLTSLSIERTPVGDDAIPHLSVLTELKELDLSGTRISDVGFAKLRQALPSVDIKTLQDPKPG